MRRKLSTTSSSVNPSGEEILAKQSRSPSVSSNRSDVVYRRRPSSPGTRVHDETQSTDQPRPVSGRLSYLFQDSETESLAPSSGITAERRPSFIESMMGILVGSGGVTAQ